MAWCRHVKVLMMVKAIILNIFLFLAFCAPVWAKSGPSVYTVAKVSVTADANDAVVAKQNAQTQAQQDALRILMKRMVSWRAYSRLPVLEDAMVERMVEGFAVRRESNSATRYVATLDFTFDQNAVRDLLNRFGLPYTDQQASEVLILPVMLEAGGLRTDTNNPWYTALSNVDGEHALAPVKLAAPRQDISVKMIEDLTNQSRELFETLKYQYHAENLVLAVAEVDAHSTQFQVRLAGHDAVGNFSLSRTYRIYDRDKNAAAGIAAEVVVKTIEGRWKSTRLASLGQGNDDSVAVENVVLSAEFSGLKQWREMRSRLQKVPGVQNLEIKGLNPRAADVVFDFPGGVNGLTQAVQAQGLAVEQRGNIWVLVMR
jgi:hypothetical protein